MKLISLLCLGFMVEILLSKSVPTYSTTKDSGKVWRLDSFNKELFWEEPPEGKHV